MCRTSNTLFLSYTACALRIDREFRTSPIGTPFDDNARMEAFLHRLHVRDDPHHPALFLETVQRADGFIKRVLVERTKPFIDEERFGAVAAGGSCAADNIGQAKRQCQRCLELFSTRERPRFTAATGVRIIDPEVKAPGAVAALFVVTTDCVAATAHLPKVG